MVNVTMYRKSVIGGEFGIEGFKKNEAFYFNANIPHIRVTPSEYNNIGESLDDLHPNILAQMKKINVGSWGYIFGGIITDGKRFLLIDTQGDNYPRYKGVMEGKRYK